MCKGIETLQGERKINTVIRRLEGLGTRNEKTSVGKIGPAEIKTKRQSYEIKTKCEATPRYILWIFFQG